MSAFCLDSNLDEDFSPTKCNEYRLVAKLLTDKTSKKCYPDRLLKCPGSNLMANGFLISILKRILTAKLAILPIRHVDAIRLLHIDAPHTIQAGQPLRLRCLYETKGDKLQSLSWYKNGREFYRYQPFERRQPVLAFNLTGVNVDVSSWLNKPWPIPGSVQILIST